MTKYKSCRAHDTDYHSCLLQGKIRFISFQKEKKR
jgi:nitroimidazol reductase NimA-like FMN-containing flavoprotein (pyridoxamine 5'-phosphate oxidase superfamily)